MRALPLERLESVYDSHFFSQISFKCKAGFLTCLGFLNCECLGRLENLPYKSLCRFYPTSAIAGSTKAFKIPRRSGQWMRQIIESEFFITGDITNRHQHSRFVKPPIRIAGMVGQMHRHDFLRPIIERINILSSSVGSGRKQGFVFVRRKFNNAEFFKPWQCHC